MQPGSRSDQCFKLTCQAHKWVCPYKDTQDTPGNRAEVDYQLPPRKPDWYRHWDRHKLTIDKGRKGEKVQKYIFHRESLYCRALGQNSNLNHVEAYKTFLSALAKQCIHTVVRRTHIPHPLKMGINQDIWEPCKDYNSRFLGRRSFSHLSDEKMNKETNQIQG